MKVIEQEIAALKNTINEMWALVHQQIYNAGEAMLTGDKELAYKVLSRERRVNAFELKIDSDCEDIIALYAPVAITHFPARQHHRCDQSRFDSSDRPVYRSASGQRTCRPLHGGRHPQDGTLRRPLHQHCRRTDLLLGCEGDEAHRQNGRKVISLQPESNIIVIDNETTNGILAVSLLFMHCSHTGALIYSRTGFHRHFPV